MQRRDPPDPIKKMVEDENRRKLDKIFSDKVPGGKPFISEGTLDRRMRMIELTRDEPIIIRPILSRVSEFQPIISSAITEYLKKLQAESSEQPIEKKY